MCIQSLAIIVQFAADAGEVEIEHQIAVSLRCGMLADVKAAEEGIELVVGVQVIIVLQHTHRQALAKATGTDKEKELVRFFY